MLGWGTSLPLDNMVRTKNPPVFVPKKSTNLYQLLPPPPPRLIFFPLCFGFLPQVGILIYPWPVILVGITPPEHHAPIFPYPLSLPPPPFFEGRGAQNKKDVYSNQIRAPGGFLVKKNGVGVFW